MELGIQRRGHKILLDSVCVCACAGMRGYALTGERGRLGASAQAIDVMCVRDSAHTSV